MIEKQTINRAEVLSQALDILTLIGNDTQLKAIGKTGSRGKELAGPCPRCRGNDRFHVLPDSQQWFCRNCTGEPESEGFKNAIDYAMIIRGMDFRAACEWVTGKADLPTTAAAAPRKPAEPKFYEHCPPPQIWQDRGRAFVAYAQKQLWQDSQALDYLHRRGLSDETIRAAGLGWNPEEYRRPPNLWGVTNTDKIWLPIGWVFPWEISGELWRVEIRRPDSAGEPKKIGPTGYKQGLYNADSLSTGKPAILVEGVIDCLTIAQHAGDIVSPVATGATGHARRARWIARLALCPLVLVAFDNEPDKGDKAALFWLNALPNAKRWRPFWEDVNQMAQDGADIRGWIEAGLALSNVKIVEPEPCELYLNCLKQSYPITLQFSDGQGVEYHTPDELYNNLWTRSMVKEAADLGGVVTDAY